MLGPVFIHEVVRVARQKWFHAARVVYASLLLLLLYVLGNNYFHPGAPPLTHARLAMFGGEVFFAIAALQFVAIYIGMPLALHRVILDERSQGTLDLLLLSPLSDREIVLGKLGSRLLAILLILATSLPVLSITLLFGGVHPWTVAGLESLSLIWAFYSGTWSIERAATQQSGSAALTGGCLHPLMSLVWVLLLLIGLFGVQFGAYAASAIGFGGTVGVLFLFSLTNLRAATNRLRSPFEERWDLRNVRDPLAGPISKSPDAIGDTFQWWESPLGPINRRPFLHRASLAGGIGMVAYAYGYIVFLVEKSVTPAVLAPLSVALFVACFVASSANALLARRPGLVDLLLATPMPTHEFLLLALSASFSWIASLASLLFVASAFFVFADPLPVAGWTILATLDAAYLLVVGHLCMLVERGSQRRVWPVFVVFLVLLLLPSWISPTLAAWAGTSMFIVLPTVSLLVARGWVPMRPTAWAVALPSLAIFVGFRGLLFAIYWCLETAIFARLGPGALYEVNEVWRVFSPLFWFHHARGAVGDDPLRGSILFGVNLLLAIGTLLGTWYWGLRCFDGLVGRVNGRRERRGRRA